MTQEISLALVRLVLVVSLAIFAVNAAPISSTSQAEVSFSLIQSRQMLKNKQKNSGNYYKLLLLT